MDTITQECKSCGCERDCIEGICLECRLKKEKRENCKDRDCEFLRHGVCVVDECVWELEVDEDYEQAIADIKPEFHTQQPLLGNENE